MRTVPSSTYSLWKRYLDVVVCLFALALAVPVLLLIAIAIRVTLGSPVMFRQLRPGIHGQPFVLYKFRTMRDSRCANGEFLPDADRLSPFGRFLRSASLDELPELWNVLRGDMSFVGPRPLLMEYLPLYSSQQARRHDVRPGITGWAQVNGRNALSWDEKFALDLYYVEHQSFLLDMKILFLTLKQVLRRDGISQQGHATMEKFRGNPA